MYGSTVEVMFLDEYRDVKLDSTVLTFIHPNRYLNFNAWFMQNIMWTEKDGSMKWVGFCRK
jgi:hypothetical protein